MNLLEVDWKMSQFLERRYPLEYNALRFCKTQKNCGKNKTKKMLDIFGRMKELKMINGIMNRMLLDDELMECVRSLVDDKFVSAITRYVMTDV